jgi:hypothetical protein
MNVFTVTKDHVLAEDRTQRIGKPTGETGLVVATVADEDAWHGSTCLAKER